MWIIFLFGSDLNCFLIAHPFVNRWAFFVCSQSRADFIFIWIFLAISAAKYIKLVIRHWKYRSLIDALRMDIDQKMLILNDWKRNDVNEHSTYIWQCYIQKHRIFEISLLRIKHWHFLIGYSVLCQTPLFSSGWTIVGFWMLVRHCFNLIFCWRYQFKCQIKSMAKYSNHKIEFDRNSNSRLNDWIRISDCGLD